MTRNLALLTLVLGVVIAIGAAAKLPEAGRTYPDTWVGSVLGLVIATVGVISWRVAVARDRRRLSATATSDASDPVSLIEAIQAPMTQLSSTAESHDLATLRGRIDELVHRYIVPFSERRNELIVRFGMRHGAEVLVDFALGERLINRAWSAAADGYAPEATDSLRAASRAFAEVANRVRQLVVQADTCRRG